MGIISGSGTYIWPGFADPQPRTCETEYGSVEVAVGTIDGVEVVHLSRHGAGHARLSNQVTHQANLQALLELHADAVVSLTVCGAVDPHVPVGTLVVFDDLYFPSNRLPDGSLCTWHTAPGAAGRGHWIFDRPFSEGVREQLIDAARRLHLPVRDGGCYGHVDGPRFNSRAEVAALAAAGVVAISQTAGPEIVLAGEAQLPLAVLGFVTDHANGVPAVPQPIAELQRLLAASTETFARVLTAALPRLDKPEPPGIVYRFGGPS
ncbi:MAG TPA: MTAP family purine nucleoside phosphorylase [Jatrophihabitantaceae bacterium]|nr:MTAP family purine nucleoside phosphorylase [Jatrophihabitantaceae bacterium]